MQGHFTKLNNKSVGIALFASLILFCTSCKQETKKVQGHLTSSRAIGGEKWLSWTPSERDRYVYGYLDGYFSGFDEACQIVWKLDLRYPSKSKDNVDEPGTNCTKARHEYSEQKIRGVEDIDVAFYTAMITELYERYPDARSAPFVLLLGLMHDGGPTNSEQLYRAQIGKWPNARVD